MKPFPIPVVPAGAILGDFAGIPGLIGPGTQGDDAPSYLPMPQMDTFSAPRIPENASQDTIHAAAAILGPYLETLSIERFARAPAARLDLGGLEAGVLEVITQSLGYGEVSAFTVAPEHWRVQETAFAGLWRILRLDAEQRIVADTLEASPIPALLADLMRTTGAAQLAPPHYPEGVMNAEALVEELRAQAARWRPGQMAHVINLTLLPVTDTDLDTLYGWLGHREVSLLSRGYGNCRITSTRLKNVWWVQYFNSMDTLILNTIEVTDMPEVALAAPEDFADSLERLGEYLALMMEPA